MSGFPGVFFEIARSAAPSPASDTSGRGEEFRAAQQFAGYAFLIDGRFALQPAGAAAAPKNCPSKCGGGDGIGCLGPSAALHRCDRQIAAQAHVAAIRSRLIYAKSSRQRLCSGRSCWGEPLLLIATPVAVVGDRLPTIGRRARGWPRFHQCASRRQSTGFVAVGTCVLALAWQPACPMRGTGS